VPEPIATQDAQIAKVLEKWDQVKTPQREERVLCVFGHNKRTCSRLIYYAVIIQELKVSFCKMNDAHGADRSVRLGD
jgi:hypothetical protein